MTGILVKPLCEKWLIFITLWAQSGPFDSWFEEKRVKPKAYIEWQKDVSGRDKDLYTYWYA